jgi:putative endonuclease
MKTSPIGQQAETAVADFLMKKGYKILHHNWKTVVCEIDLVAKKGDVVYFIEVKYRSSPVQGSGFEYIGPQKLKKMNFAAQVWIQNNRWDGDYRLLAAQVQGLNFENIEIIEID